MQVTKETWRMREQCVPGSLSSSPAREPGNEASVHPVDVCCCFSADTPYVTPISSILMLTTRVVTGTQGGHGVRVWS